MALWGKALLLGYCDCRFFCDFWLFYGQFCIFAWFNLVQMPAISDLHFAICLNFIGSGSHFFHHFSISPVFLPRGDGLDFHPVAFMLGLSLENASCRIWTTCGLSRVAETGRVILVLLLIILWTGLELCLSCGVLSTFRRAKQKSLPLAVAILKVFFTCLTADSAFPFD